MEGIIKDETQIWTEFKSGFMYKECDVSMSNTENIDSVIETRIGKGWWMETLILS